MRRKNPATRSPRNSGGSKIKTREKSVLPKTGPDLKSVERMVDIATRIAVIRIAEISNRYGFEIASEFGV